MRLRRGLGTQRVTHPLPDSDRLSCNAQGAEEDPMNTPQQEPAEGTSTRRWKKESKLANFQPVYHTKLLYGFRRLIIKHSSWMDYLYGILILDLGTLLFKGENQPRQPGPFTLQTHPVIFIMHYWDFLLLSLENYRTISYVKNNIIFWFCVHEVSNK